MTNNSPPSRPAEGSSAKASSERRIAAGNSKEEATLDCKIATVQRLFRMAPNKRAKMRWGRKLQELKKQKEVIKGMRK